MNKKILILVDCQNDFIDGSLGVNGAKDMMNALTRFISQHKDDYDKIFLTLDWHPANHCSFKENGGIWPKHCIAFDKGAAIYSPLYAEIANSVPSNKYEFLLKGTYENKEEYSAFDDIDNLNKIDDFWEQQDTTKIDICGICGDICVLNTINGLIKLGFKDINPLTEFCPCIDYDKFDNFIKELNGGKS